MDEYEKANRHYFMIMEFRDRSSSLVINLRIFINICVDIFYSVLEFNNNAVEIPFESEEWIIIICLELDSETMLCSACLTTFSCFP